MVWSGQFAGGTSKTFWYQTFENLFFRKKRSVIRNGIQRVMNVREKTCWTMEKKISLNILNIFRKGQRMSLLLTNPDQVQLK